jgi:hypothetical protein
MLLLIGPHKLAVCAAVGFILLQTHNKQTFGPAARDSLSLALLWHSSNWTLRWLRAKIKLISLLCSFSCL